MNILDKIVARKKQEIEQAQQIFPANKLEKFRYFNEPCRSLKSYLTRSDKSGIIAEFKRKSPSQGFINEHASLEEVTLGYEKGSASALSILTDESFFGGSNHYLTAAKNFIKVPLLRKDFIVDEYQVLEAKAIGADAILLIAECLSESAVRTLAAFARSLGLEVLLEIHSADQLSKMHDNIDVLGVNNRDLKTFKTDIQTSEKLLEQMPVGDYVKISESGIENPETIRHLKQIGYQGFLIGTYFMKHDKPQEAFADFVESIHFTSIS